MDIMRAFLAIDIDRAVREEVCNFIDQVSKTTRGVSWVRPENIHLTLKFLGEIQEGTPEAIAAGLNPWLTKLQPFSLLLKGAGGFPNLKTPRVLWVGIDLVNQLKALYDTVEDVCEGLGFQREKRPFSPHITIGRVKGVVDPKALSKMYERAQHVWGTTLVREVNIMRSVLRPTGAEYSVLLSLRIG